MVTLKEVLVHDENSVDLSLLNDKAAVLFNHDFDNHIGCVIRDSARIDADRVGRCLIQFSKIGHLANEVSGKVREGTMEKVSVGYNVLEYKADFDAGIMYVTRWQPYEVSICSCPCDSSVGVGRSLNKGVIDLTEGQTVNEEDKKEQEIPEEQEQQTEEIENPQETPEEVPQEQETGSNEELNKEQEGEERQIPEPMEEENIEEEEKPFERPQEDIEEMRAIGEHLNISKEEIQEAIEDKTLTVESFKQRALNTNTESKTHRKGKNTMTDTMQNLETKFNLSAALRSLAEDKPLVGAEAEYSQEMARKAAQRGRAQRTNSVFVPTGAMRSNPVKTSTIQPLVGTEIRNDSFIDLMLEKSVLGELGVKTLTGLTAPISLPRMTKNAADAFGFVNENGEGALADVAFNGVPMSMKTFTGAVAISRQSMLSMPDIGALVAEHLLKASRIKLEKLILGDQENPNASNGLVKQLVDAGKVVKCGLTHKDFLTEIAKLTDAGVDEAAIKLAMRGALAADLASTLRDQAVAGYIMENGKIANRPVHTSGVLAEGSIILGDFSSALTIGEWSGLEIDVDTTSLRSKGGVAVRVWADLDWAVSNPDAIRVIQKNSLPA
nr:phage major capsid protein [Providencia sp. JUb39]